MGGDASPPTSLKVTILAEKSASVSNNPAPFRDASPPTDLNVTNPAKNQSQFWWRPFFLETTWIWAKKTFEFPISAKKSLSILVKTSEFLRFCASNPPPPKFSGSATGSNYRHRRLGFELDLELARVHNFSAQPFWHGPFSAPIRCFLTNPTSNPNPNPDPK